MLWISNFKVTLIIYTIGTTFDNHNNLFQEKFYFLFKIEILNVATGSRVAIKNEQNSKDLEINSGKILVGNKIPTNNDLVKLGVGKNKSPPINPKIIEK